MPTKDTKRIRIGYADLLEKDFLSSVEINREFLRLLGEYADVRTIPLKHFADIKDLFKKIDRYKFDYLYVDAFAYLLESFLLREKLGLDIPFIVKLHSVRNWAYMLVYIIPLIRKGDIVYAPSRQAKELFAKISDKVKVRVITNCLDFRAIYAISPRPDIIKENRVTFLGRITAEKGVGALIECMPKILAKVKEAHLHIIGPLSGVGISDTPECAYVKQLRARVRKLGLNNSVTFHGVKRGTEKFDLLARSKVFVNPTLAQEETFSIVNIEAMASGVPVVTTDWSGIGEYVKDGKNGFLLKPVAAKNKMPKVDAKGLSDAVVRLLADDKLNKALGAAAYKSVCAMDYKKIIPGLIALLRKRRGHTNKQACKWKDIKNKRVVDFHDKFSRDFLIFLYYQGDFRLKSYGDLFEARFEKRKPSQDMKKGKGIHLRMQQNAFRLFQ